jgi:mRNA-degrading endonuclease toxin of MazEF toxin-antitoxin module
MRPEQGDVVLIPVPFTDLSTNKRRPVIVISNDAYHSRTNDTIVVAMTSNPATAPYSFIITDANLQNGTLNRPGTVRVDRDIQSFTEPDYAHFWSRR